MKKINYNIIGLGLLLMLGMVACKYDQEVEPIASTEDYPKTTFTSTLSGNAVAEGDTIDITITTDKMFDLDLDFSAVMLEGTADDHDYLIDDVTMGAYSNEISMQLIIADNDGSDPLAIGVPEVSETLKLEIGVMDLGRKDFINPASENLILDLTITNVNDPNSLTVALGWANHDNDIDLFSTSELGGAWAAGATSANPETMNAVANADDDGNYFIGIDPFHVEGTTVNYWIAVGHPDQTNEFFTGVFDMGALDSYTLDYFDAWDMDTYRMLSVAKAGDTYTVTNENE